ncbi:MAG TPA: sigma-54-dependent Fis family transcriptional regulator [Kofleriaceae bacterium]|nr:sigma-54-dependent Fis family transcriptional regulator [Kofleriaceae bacterium]
MDADLVLVIVPVPGASPLRVPLTKRITSIGSDASADLRLVTAPARWAVVHSPGSGSAHVEVVLAATGERRRLEPGERLLADGIALAVESIATERARERSIEELVSALAAVDTPERAVEQMLTGLIAASGADLGALILGDGEAYSVAAARDKHGAVLEGAHELLSDTIVRDVLGSGERVRLDDVAANSRYAAIPSVTAMKLGSALCLPMRLDGRTLGAVFLARHDRFTADDRTLGELQLLAAIAVPLLAQVRRHAPPSGDEIVGESKPIVALRALIKRVGAADLSALLHGPSGSGKELVARALHHASARAGKPMIAINCASVAPTLLDAELFGYRKGAFTGAMTDRTGLIEAAHGSTLFLDEIGDMPLAMQAALLRVLEQREVKRLGDTTPRPVDFRLVCATHCDLEAEVAAGRFRADLLFRLREVTLEVPPLAERGDDVVLLAHAFLRQAESQLGLAIHTLTDDAQAALRAHLWPGNVRELKATMRRVAVLADSRLIRAADLGFGTPAPRAGTPVAPAGLGAWLDATVAGPLQPLATLRDELVRRYVELAVERCDGDRDAAAKALEIGVRSLYRYLS